MLIASKFDSRFNSTINISSQFNSQFNSGVQTSFQINSQFNPLNVDMVFFDKYHLSAPLPILVGYAISVYTAGDRTTTTMLSSLGSPYRDNANVL